MPVWWVTKNDVYEVEEEINEHGTMSIFPKIDKTLSNLLSPN